MTELDKAQKRISIAQEMFDLVKHMANEERKVSCEKHIRSHYTKALEQIDVELTSARGYLSRVEHLSK